MPPKKTVVVLEHIWNDASVPHNKDVSVLPYIDGICRLNDYELFYGRYIDGVGFNKWMERFKDILASKERRIILYLAGHGSKRTLGNKKLSTLLSQVWGAANHLNIEGCILGGCFVGQNIDEMKVWMTESSLTWMIGYKHAIDWLPSTLMDMKIISDALSCRQDNLTDSSKLKNLFINAASLFNPNVYISTDKAERRQDFQNTVACVIQPRTQGQKPISIEIF